MSDIRGELVAEVVTETLTGMLEMGLTPPEGNMVGEVLLWQLLRRMLEDARTETQQATARLTALRIAMRLTSRVEAWPADIRENQ
jgi:hypothetical protein